MEDRASHPVRASDDERDQVLGVLRERAAEGRMSHDTFERRVEQVLRARSREELAAVVHDLPAESRLVDRMAGAVSSLSQLTSRIGAAWRAPRLPRFVLPPAGFTRMVIGRAPGCHLTLTDLTVSRLHAELYLADDGWMLADLGSMNGTRLNGWRLVGPARVRPGDEIGFGRARFIVAARLQNRRDRLGTTDS